MLYKFYQRGSASMAGVQRQWPYLRLAEMYLLYAEALIQNNQFGEAIKQINEVRARVGLPGLKESNPGKDFNNKDVMIKELLRERACELGFEDTRFFDMIRYKLKADFEKTLHGLRIYRVDGKDEDGRKKKAHIRANSPTRCSRLPTPHATGGLPDSIRNGICRHSRLQKSTRAMV